MVLYEYRTGPKGTTYSSFLANGSAPTRQIAERSPDIARQLHHIARQLEADANGLAAKDTE